ncbi:MAG TPA: hypothetical protein VNU68_01755 [Verrucomicrobiae bacterium]|nr:hypothetical protein [Verrucomicrobiae bacterium]
MTVGARPIVGRELLVAARRSSTYWARFQAALMALVVAGLIVVDQTMSPSAPAVMGARLFRTLSFLALIYVMLAAVRLTSDCLSSEKREGTLGFLFLTDLKPLDVVIGKLTATSLSGLYGLAAILPVLVLPVLCGGVSLGDVCRLAVLLLNSLFFAVAVALLVSAWCWQARTAASMSFLILLAISVVTPVVAVCAGGLASLSAGVGLLSPLTACWLAVGGGTGRATEWFWVSVLLTHLLAWLCLTTCGRCLPKLWMDRPVDKNRMRWREWCRGMLMGNARTRAAFRVRALRRNPIFWLGSREVRVRWYPWLFLGSIAAIIGLSCWGLQVRRVDLLWLLVVGFALHLFFKQWLTHFASSAFATDREQGALELLLSTPLSVRDLMGGHRLVLWRQFGYPLLFLVLMELAGWICALGEADADRWLISGFFLGGIIIFVADLWAMAWLGWWMGAVSRTAAQASSATALRILLLPVGLLGVSLLTVHLVWNMPETVFLWMSVFVYVFISVGIDGWFGGRARHRLLTELRVVAVERYASGDTRPGSWAKLRRILWSR